MHYQEDFIIQGGILLIRRGSIRKALSNYGNDCSEDELNAQFWRDSSFKKKKKLRKTLTDNTNLSSSPTVFDRNQPFKIFTRDIFMCTM